MIDRIAQIIWECYAVDTGRALPAGMADRAAVRIVAELGLTQEVKREQTGTSNPPWRDRLLFDPVIATRYVTTWGRLDSSQANVVSLGPRCFYCGRPGVSGPGEDCGKCAGAIAERQRRGETDD